MCSACGYEWKDLGLDEAQAPFHRIRTLKNPKHPVVTVFGGVAEVNYGKVIIVDLDNEEVGED